MAVFTVGKHNTREEGPEGGAEPDELHQGGDGHHKEKRRGGEEFPQVGSGNETKKWNDEVPAGKVDDAYSQEQGYGLHPSWELFNKAVISRAHGGFDCEKRQYRQHGDHRNVLEKQYRKGSLPGSGL
jgi:hypothetical protein